MRSLPIGGQGQIERHIHRAINDGEVQPFGEQVVIR